MTRHRHLPAKGAQSRAGLPWLCAMFLWSTMAATGVAQTPCDVLLPQAEASYAEARFDDVPELIAGCLKAKPSRRQQSVAYSLLAKSYVMADRLQAARTAIGDLLRIDPDFEPDTGRDPFRFVRLVETVKRESATPQVASVSKTAESLAEAPATVVVVTAEEIERRGYTDLEAVIHDLPGFDISRSTGQSYSNLYQRGLRSEFTDRTLVLIDGVEENDLYLDAVWLSRQYPVKNVERIEVVYGPASTMYGASAFAGVINVITKQPEELIGRDRKLGVLLDLYSGSYNTSSFEANLAGQRSTGSLAWTLTARKFHSDEPDLSKYPQWNYDPADFEGLPYEDLVRITGATAINNFLAAVGEENCSGQPGCLYEVTPDAVVLTPEGVSRAIELDQANYPGVVRGRPVGFSNESDDWSIHSKLRVQNLELGFMLWSRNEGHLGGFSDLFSPGSDNGKVQVPKFQRFYAKYSKRLKDNLVLSTFSRFKYHKMAPPTSFVSRVSYSQQSLGIPDLLKGTEAFWFPFYYSISSTQFKNELNLVYTPSDRLMLVSGVETINSVIQGALVTSTEPDPEATGVPGLDIRGGNDFNIRDVGIYAQASFRLRQNLKIVAGGRFDHDARKTPIITVAHADPTQPPVVLPTPGEGSYGTVFNPRLAVVYFPRDFVFKAIYAEAFQPPPNFKKFLTTPGVQALPAPNLAPEKVKSVELSAIWHPAETVSVELAAYDSSFSDVVQFNSRVPCDSSVISTCTGTTTGQFQNLGSLQIRGAQASVSWKHKNYTFYSNYTFTDPTNTDSAGRKSRIADIASHQVNLGANALIRERFNVNLRVNYVGAKDRGPGTTINSTTLPRIDGYTVLNTALTYKNILPHSSLQLVVNNLLDEEYDDPGVRSADGFVFVEQLPQRGRHAYLRLVLSF